MITIAGRTDIGCVRANNEDRFGADILSAAPDESAALCIVADGMGGHAKGEVASETAVDLFRQLVFDGGGASADWSALLPQALARCNAAVCAIGLDGAEQSPGTTLTAMALTDREYWIIHAGDSRAYLLRDRVITRLTNDHSWVNEEVASGRRSLEEAMSSPFRHIITRALGLTEELAGDLIHGASQADDIFVLCSDGLSRYVDDESIARIVTSSPGLDSAGAALISAANDAGGKDNITVVLARVDGGGLTTAERDMPTGRIEPLTRG